MTALNHSSPDDGADVASPQPPDADAGAGPIAHTCRRVVEGRRAARALADWTRQFELSEPEFQVLWCLREVFAGGLDQKTLAQQLALSPAQMSATVERLGAQGWISQHARPDDRRRRLWQLSATGRAMLQMMIGRAACLLCERVAPVPPAGPAMRREAAA